MVRHQDATREAVIGVGIDYGYGNAVTQTPYRLGEQPIGPFLKEVYGRLGTLPVGATVVDLGCGAGRFALHAPENRSWQWYGVDHDPTAVTQAQEVLKPGDKVITGDITQLDKLNSGFGAADAAVSHRVLHALPVGFHLPILRSAAALLEPGGELFLSVAADTDWKARTLKDRGLFKPGTLNDCKAVMFDDFGVEHPEGFDMHFFAADEIEKLAVTAGFKVSDRSAFEESTGYEHLIDAGVEANQYWGIHLSKNQQHLGSSPPQIGSVSVNAGFNSSARQVD